MMKFEERGWQTNWVKYEHEQVAELGCLLIHTSVNKARLFPYGILQRCGPCAYDTETRGGLSLKSYKG